MFRVTILSYPLASLLYGPSAEQYVMITNDDNGSSARIRGFKTHGDMISSAVGGAICDTLMYACPYVQTTDRIPGDAPQMYESLCERLGVHSEEQDAQVEAMGMAASAAYDVQPQIGETRPESGRQISAAVCADCGNAECTCSRK